MTFPRTARALREALDAYGLRPRKRHGQHFLTDPQAVDAIVRDAGVRSEDHVIEVGTGVGLLTHVLCETGARVTSFEVDEEILALARSLRDWPDTVTFVEGDVLAGKRALAEPFLDAIADRAAAPGRTLLVSNLPYGAGTPIVLGVLGLERPPDDLVVMLQQEVVEKLLAEAGSGNYGAPSVMVHLTAKGEVLRRFGPEVFWPRPKVRSMVARLTPREDAALSGDEHHDFGTFVTALFSHRRKVLPTAMKSALEGLDPDRARQALADRDLDPKVRVGAVRPEDLLAVWRALTAP